MRILPIVLLALSTSVMAQDVKVIDDTANFGFVNPTTRINGDPLDFSELSEYRIKCEGKVVLTFPAAEGKDGEYEAQTADFLPEHGEYSCFMAVVDNDGLVSPWSNEVRVAWPEPVGSEGTPEAPTGLGTEF